MNDYSHTSIGHLPEEEKAMLPFIKKAILIRRTEQQLLQLFSMGKLNGTVHTCVGQEFSAVAVINDLDKDDFIASNHRGHGHYIARTNDIRGLIAEVMGKKEGSVGGIGGSQHLAAHNYLSNGIQGGMTPIVAGVALANKLKNNSNIAIAFVGDGTFGEGILYETLNISAIWSLPALYVLENNGYAQSTSMQQTFAGSVEKRIEGFGIKYFTGTTDEPLALMKVCEEARNYIRENSKPAFLEIKTSRLNSHSKSDDNRSDSEIEALHTKDYLNRFKLQYEEDYLALEAAADEQIKQCVTEADAGETLTYYSNQEFAGSNQQIFYQSITGHSEARINALLGDLFKKKFEDDRFVMLGEDIEYKNEFTQKAYGGAFKVSGDLSDKFPLRTRNTPISEAAIIGIGTGLAVAGMRPLVEIMFGDFLTLGLDQLLQHASKFKRMFNGKVNVPLIVRTPMGGKRGYGPTHSQSIEKFFLGIPDLSVIAINHRIDPSTTYQAIFDTCTDPVLVVENKILYTRKWNEHPIEGFLIEQSNETFATVKVSPEGVDPSVTIVCYGGMLEDAELAIQKAFDEADIFCEIICPTRLYPLDMAAIAGSVKKTGRLLMLEEGPPFAALGSEIIARLAEMGTPLKKVSRMGNHTIVPCSLEAEINLLPNPGSIFNKVKEVYNG